MGLNVNSAAFLLLAHAQGVSFTRTLMIGRQSLGLTSRDIEYLAALPLEPGLRDRLRALDITPGAYAEDFLRLCGAATVDAMDKTAYEGATVLHDLNRPVPESLHGRYDLVVDGGSIEHVFNVPVALANYMRLLAVDGHYFCNTATNNYTGHGFYQLGPELFQAAFVPANGFADCTVVLYEETGGHAWYRLTPAATAARRLTFQGAVPAHLLVLARKTADVEPFAEPPQQRMYDAAWTTSGAAEALAHGSAREQLLRRLAGVSPRAMWWLLNTWNRRKRFRPDMFTPVSWHDLRLGPR